MNWTIRIKAAAMLIIMLVMIGHDSIPHSHHHDHAHHDHPHGANDNLEKGILDRLFEEHTRNNHSHKYTQAGERPMHLQREITRVAPLVAAGMIISSYSDISSVRCVLFCQPDIGEPCLHSSGLRAPPFYH